MANVLDFNMSPEDRLLLAQLKTHPAYPVLCRMMAEKCQQATDAVIKLDPVTDQYARKLAALQQTSRAINDFCSSLLRSIDYHIMCGTVEEAQSEADIVSQVHTMMDRIKNSNQQ